MSEDSGFKILITNQSKKDRTIRLVIAIILILVNLVAASSMSQLLSMITLGVAGVLIFNTISGNCYIYRMLVMIENPNQMVVPLLTQRQRGYGQPLAMQVRIQIVKNLEYLACLEIRKTNHEQ